MKLTSAMQAQIASGSFHHEFFVYVTAKEFDTGASQELGLWTGADDFTTSIDGVSRTFLGSGSMLSIPNFTYSIGLDVQTQKMGFSILSPEVTNLIRGYDARFAPIQVYLGIFDPANMSLKGISEMFRGFIDKIDIFESEETSTCDVSLVSEIREGTKPLTLFKTAQSQALIDPNDNGFKYGTIAGTTKVAWGVEDSGWQVPKWKG